MGWFKRREQVTFTLPLPHADGRSWTFEAAGARRDFAARTTYESGYRNAFDPPAPAIAEALVDRIEPDAHARLGTAAEDEPYIRQMLMTAAQVGAGLSSVDPHAGQDTHDLDPAIAGAFLLADDDLPAQTAEQRTLGRYLIQAGHYAARFGLDTLP